MPSIEVLRIIIAFNSSLTFYVLNFLFLYYFPKSSNRLEVTYANNNSLIKKFENMPTPEPVENGKKSKKSAKKSFAEKSKGLMSGVKEVVSSDAFF